MAGFVDRMVGAAKLDVNIYEEVEADTSATMQAMTVVILTAVSAGVGQYASDGLPGLIGGAIGQLIAWCVWAFAAYIIGTKILPEPGTSSNMGELLRTIGFASSPGVLYVVAFAPVAVMPNLVGGALTVLLALGIWIWQLVAWVVAVRQALDYKSTGRAVAVCVISFIAYVVAAAIVLFILGVILVALGLAAGAAAGTG
ncbi:MAG: YIP1 family protein [Candidatus Acidiferrales bacterium]